MKTIAVAVLAGIAALAAAGFAWQQSQALEAARAELASANAQMQKANADVLAVRAESAALRKEFTGLKLAADRALADLGVAQSFIEAEKTARVHLIEELMKTKEQLASSSRSRSAQAPQMNLLPGMVRVVPTQPMVIRAAPSGGTAASATMAAPAPSR